VVGRFTTIDPIGLLGGSNNYEYAPNPVTWIDPLGLSCKEPKYPLLKEMDPDYVGEELGIAKAWEPFGAEIEYLTKEQRKNYEIVVKDGLVYDAKGIPLNSGNSINGKLMYVMDSDGKIYSGPQRIMEFHHSSFLAGAPVAAAREIDVAGGFILTHSRNSGHYKPNKEHHDQFIAEMNERGVDLSKVVEEPVE
jgi:uncharacterized protein RhaS with RHS repeats